MRIGPYADSPSQRAFSAVGVRVRLLRVSTKKEVKEKKRWVSFRDGKAAKAMRISSSEWWLLLAAASSWITLGSLTGAFRVSGAPRFAVRLGPATEGR